MDLLGFSQKNTKTMPKIFTICRRLGSGSHFSGTIKCAVFDDGQITLHNFMFTLTR